MKRRGLKLTAAERAWLEDFTGSGSAHHQAFKRAQILLAADEPNGLGDAELAKVIGVSKATVYNVRSRCLALGIEQGRTPRGTQRQRDTREGRWSGRGASYRVSLLGHP